MKTLVVVGVGALGSHAVLFSRNLPVSLVLVDFDRVEQKNVLAQVHPRTAVGRNKAEAMKQTMLGLFGLRVDAIPHRLAADNVDVVLGRADLVLDCVDNGATRRLIQGWVRARRVPCLHGALSAAGDFARLVWDEHFTVDDEPAGGAATCEDGAILPFAGLAGAMLADTLALHLRDGSRRSVQLSAGGWQVLAHDR